MAKVVGIDLGTTNSCVAVMEGGKPTVIANAEGQRTTPSVVAHTKNKEKLVGQIAKRQAVMNPENTFYSVKRFTGRKYDEVSTELTEVSYKVMRDGKGNVKLNCPALSKQFAPEEISAEVLRSADRTRAEGLIKDLREAINQENYDRMKSVTDNLQQALMQIGSAVYAQAGASGSTGSGSSGGSSDEVIDADFAD